MHCFLHEHGDSIGCSDLNFSNILIGSLILFGFSIIRQFESSVYNLYEIDDGRLDLCRLLFFVLLSSSIELTAEKAVGCFNVTKPKESVDFGVTEINENC